ncbi:MAG: GAF domain-containing protein [Chloroflexi bacterium]|nr:GAF domain-containing protein [Chloroflexota bacterium]
MANDTFKRLFGLGAEKDLTGEPYQAHLPAAVCTILNAGSEVEEPPVTLRQSIRRASGELSKLDVEIASRVHDGRRLWHVIIHDVEDVDAIYTEVRAAEERYWQLFDGITDVGFIIDRDWRYTQVNRAASRATALNEDQIIGKRVVDLMPDIADSIHWSAYRKLAASRQPMRFTSDFALPGGLPGSKYEVCVYPVENGLLCIAQDVTAKVRTEEAEREQRILAEALRDTAAVLNSTLELEEVLDRVLTNLSRVVRHDAANIMIIEDGVARVVRSRGYTDRGLRSALLSSRQQVASTPWLRTVVESQDYHVIEDVHTDPDWVSFMPDDWIRSHISVPIRSDQQVTGCLNLVSEAPGFFQRTQGRALMAFADQSAIAMKNARIYRTMLQYSKELEARNRELDAFSYTVAHDLKVPLQVVMGFANMLSEELPEELQEKFTVYLENIERYTEKMHHMIDDLLFLARLSESNEAINPVSMDDVVSGVIESLHTRLEDRGVDLRVDGSLPRVMGNDKWLVAAVSNLVENGIKYIGVDNPAPQIIISAHDHGGKVRVSVQDNGLGIAEEDLDKLFKMFSRIPTEEEIEGTGLGLSIVDRIINKLGGAVGVESILGEGSIFWFELPSAG